MALKNDDELMSIESLHCPIKKVNGKAQICKSSGRRVACNKFAKEHLLKMRCRTRVRLRLSALDLVQL